MEQRAELTAGETTRERILEAAADLVLNRGFAGTSLDLLLKRVGITKGAFFYHFKSKGELGRALIERQSRQDGAILDELLGRAERLSKDPLQQVLILVGLLEEVAREREEAPEGCLFATYTYENQQFDEDIRKIVAEAFLRWRRAISAKLREAAALHPPRMEADPEQLADMLNTLTEGAFILSRVLDEPLLFPDQLRQFRNYLELLFDHHA